MMICSSNKFCFAVLLLIAALFGLWLETSFLCLDHLRDYHEPWRSYPVDKLDWDGQRPLNIVFLTWGSRGDHQPNVALGLELARQGHNVTVMAMKKYRGIVDRHDPLIKCVEMVDNNLQPLAKAFGKSQGQDFIPLTKEYVISSSRELIPQYIKVAKDADLLIGSHSAMLMLQHMSVAETLHKPLILLTHDLTLPTAEYSFNAAESRVMDYGRRMNVFNHRMFGIVMGAALTLGASSEIREIRRNHLGLDTPWPFMSLSSPEALADYPIISTADTTLWKPSSDRPPHWYSTGFFVTIDEGRETPQGQTELQDWIDMRKEQFGRPLVYFGQGSFDHHDRSAFTEILLDTLSSLELDAIALASTVDDDNDDDDKEQPLPNHVKIVGDLDQTLVFPQCQVVVHHGGAGSASQCIRSGTPGLCIPSMPFQQVWGSQLQDFGAGVVLLPQEMIAAWRSHKNRTNLLSHRIQQAMTEPIKKAARELGEKARRVSSDKGVSFAAEKILELMRNLRIRQLQEGTKTSYETEF